MLFLAAMRVGFSQWGNAFFHRLESLNEILDFHIPQCILKGTLPLFFSYFLIKTEY